MFELDQIRQEFALQLMHPDLEISQALAESETATTSTLANAPGSLTPEADIQGILQDMGQHKSVPVQLNLPHNTETSPDVTLRCRKQIESQSEPKARRWVSRKTD